MKVVGDIPTLFLNDKVKICVEPVNRQQKVY